MKHEVMNKYKALLFDLDGTLLDTLDDLAGSANYALRQHGYPQRSLAEVRRFLGNGIKMLMQHCGPAQLTEAEADDLLNTFRQHYLEHSMDATRPYPGILPLLDALQQRGVPMAIISNKLQPAVTELNAHFFSAYITTAVGESPTVRRKPNPDAVLAALTELGCAREEALYIGDSEVDIQTARNAEMACAAVTWGFRDRDELECLQPDFLIDEPAQLLELALPCADR